MAPSVKMVQSNKCGEQISLPGSQTMNVDYYADPCCNKNLRSKMCCAPRAVAIMTPSVLSVNYDSVATFQ